jgi:UDP-N-acetylglucosamine 4-epimerase
MNYHKAKERLLADPKTWLVTGAAGFIGSNIAETLLSLNQWVIGLDNFSTGNWNNLQQFKPNSRFHFIEGDVRELEICQLACKNADYVLHEAAVVSVAHSVDDPIHATTNNVDGFLNVLFAVRDQRVKRLVYASSSSVYGDRAVPMQVENLTGNALSPYAVTKYVNELYANVFRSCYGTETIGLRYFNVFGPRQAPEGGYASVIPRWASAIHHQESVFINGDGKTNRDFVHVSDVVQANILAATTENSQAINQVFNIGTGFRTTLNELIEMFKAVYPHVQPVYRAPRVGDAHDSCANIDKAILHLGYQPANSLQSALHSSLKWYDENL